jgi:hypothetical protein
MTDIDAAALNALAERIVADNRKARRQGREMAAKLMEALPEVDQEEFSNVVEAITDGAIGAIERPGDEQG